MLMFISGFKVEISFDKIIFMETMTSRKGTLVKEWLLVNLIVGCKLLR